MNDWKSVAELEVLTAEVEFWLEAPGKLRAQVEARAAGKTGKFDRRVKSVYMRKLNARTLDTPARRASQIAVEINSLDGRAHNIESLTKRVRASLKRQALV
jgi:hypothetical protein